MRQKRYEFEGIIQKVPDIDGAYIIDSAQIADKVKPKIQAILDKVNSGEI